MRPGSGMRAEAHAFSNFASETPKRGARVDAGSRQTELYNSSRLNRCIMCMIFLNAYLGPEPNHELYRFCVKAIQLFTARFSVALRFSWSRIDFQQLN